MKNLNVNLLVVIVILTITFGSTFLYSSVRVGEEFIEKFETPHPYKSLKGVVWQHEFIWSNASYISIHFSAFNLAIGDYVEISSPNGIYIYKYERNGKFSTGNNLQISNFWATHIPGDTAVVKLYSNGENQGWGFIIDKWAHGYTRQYVDALVNTPEAGDESICGADDKQWIKCYVGTPMYDKSKAVARLLINGIDACTGFLLGSGGHLLTNDHCIGSQSDADNTDYEFMAEGDTCSTDCLGWGDCPGTVVTTSATLIKRDYALDYSLLLLPTNVSSQYGYLMFRNSLPSIGERIYIPQHPMSKGKQIAVYSDVENGYCQIQSTTEIPCHGGPSDIGYYADTEGGSSGSPVIAYSDNLVVAMHHCSQCLNRGVPIPDIISHLGDALPECAVPQTPVANFVADKTCAFVGETVNFTDASTCSTSWNWTLPGGTPSASSIQNPSISYNTAGDYDVSLTVSNSIGSDTIIKTNGIHVCDFLPNFTYTINELTAAFTDGSTASNTTIIGWNWNFGDGESSTLQSPVHTYAGEGTYNVTLTVTVSDCGLPSKSMGPIPITVQITKREVHADFTYKAVKLAVTFTDKSTAVNTTIKNWNWNFGDGFFSTLQNPSHKYAAAGSYHVKLTVSDGVSATNTATQIITVYPDPTLIADFKYIIKGLTITFTDISKCYNTSITNWKWNFGDGTWSTLKNPSHTYASLGNYIVKLTISNGNAISNSITKLVSHLSYCANITANSSAEWIAGVYLGGTYNESGGSGYADYTNIIFTLYRTAPISSYALTLKPGYYGAKHTVYWTVCIDYNHNGLFNDANETIYNGSGIGMKMGSFTVPSSALLGNTRMRVLMQSNAQAQPCIGVVYGEVEDYTVHID